MQVGYLGHNETNGDKIILRDHPRKELMEYYGYKSASKMYCDTKDGKIKHIGYVIGPHWIKVYSVHEWKEAM